MNTVLIHFDTTPATTGTTNNDPVSIIDQVTIILFILVFDIKG